MFFRIYTNICYTQNRQKSYSVVESTGNHYEPIARKDVNISRLNVIKPNNEHIEGALGYKKSGTTLL